MIIGVPKEIKNNENRVGMTPSGVAEVVKQGHRVFIQHTAGVNSGFPDEAYQAVGAHVLNAVLCHPAQLVLGLGGVGVALSDIAGAAGVDDVGDLLAAGLFKGMEHFQHAVALAGAQVADEQAAVRFQLPDGAHMAAGQVHHMDVVAHAGAVRGGVVVAEHMHLFQLADRHLGDVGHQVVGDAVGVLADEAGLVGTDGVEVAQQGHVQAGVGLADILQDALSESLGGAVGVGGGTHGEVLGDRHTGGVAVDGGGRAEHKLFYYYLLCQCGLTCYYVRMHGSQFLEKMVF